jgi:hypothetical protein
MKVRKIKNESEDFMNIREALTIVINESNNPYAIAYAKAGLELGGSINAEVIQTDNIIEIRHEKTGKMMIGDELKCQILYVLSNLQNWRGEKAREVKTILKNATK